MAAPMIQLAFAELMDWFAKEDPKGSSSKKKSKHKEFVVTFATSALFFSAYSVDQDPLFCSSVLVSNSWFHIFKIDS